MQSFLKSCEIKGEVQKPIDRDVALTQRTESDCKDLYIFSSCITVQLRALLLPQGMSHCWSKLCDSSGTSAGHNIMRTAQAIFACPLHPAVAARVAAYDQILARTMPCATHSRAPGTCCVLTRPALLCLKPPSVMLRLPTIGHALALLQSFCKAEGFELVNPDQG